MFALDLETTPEQGDLSNGYALEPWRVRQRKARISSIAVTGDGGFELQVEHPTKEQLISILRDLKGQEVYCQFTTFDTAWLIASIEDDKTQPLPAVMRDIRWRDTQLLCKWITNGQQAEDMKFSYSLVNMVASFLKESPGTEEFVKMKQQVTLDPNDPYWLKRGMMDAIKTLELAHFLESKLKPEQRRGYLIEQRNIPFIANSWLLGVKINQDKLLAAERHYTAELNRLLAETGLGITKEVISSPAQLGQLVYGKLGLPVTATTPTGQPSAAADTIKLLAYQTKDERLLKIVEAKECVTILSKYIKTTKEALERTGDGYMYGVPKIFGAVTGRFTMSNETLKDQKVSMAMHQIPRKAKIIREMMEAPDGMQVMEADAMAQESRIMAIWSRDQNLINIFKNKIDPHAWMAGEVYGTPWQRINETRKAGDKEAEEKRQNGKLVNLSCNFRIGGKALARKSFTEYDKWMSEEDGRYLVQMFKRSYPGIPRYWDAILDFARANGYTYTLAQRRYKVNKWGGQDSWKTEGTVISLPIQGTAAEHFHATMTACHDHCMMTTLHDAMFFAVRSEEEAKEITAKMNSVDYASMWNVELPIPLPFESKVGNSFAEVK